MISWLAGLKTSLESFFLQRNDWMLLLGGNPRQVLGVVPILEQTAAEWSDLEVVIRTEPFETPEQYVGSVCQGIASDWEALRVWVSLEGGEIPAGLEPLAAHLEPVQQLRDQLNALRLQVLRTGISRIGLVLMPSSISAVAEWQQFLRRLLSSSSELSGWAGSRLIAWSGGVSPGPLGLAPSWSKGDVLLQKGPWSGCVWLTINMTWTSLLEQLEQDERAETDTSTRQSLQLMRGSALLSREKLDAGFAVLEGVTQEAAPEQAAAAALVAGQHRLRLGQIEAALALFRQALEQGEKGDDPVLLEGALAGMVACLTRLMRDDDLLPVLRQLLLVSTGTGNGERQGEALEGLVLLHMRRGDGHEALSAARLGLTLEASGILPSQPACFREAIRTYGALPAPSAKAEFSPGGRMP